MPLDSKLPLREPINHKHVIELFVCIAVMLTFLGLGVHSVRTGVAVIKSYRFHREKDHYLFWSVVTMWFMGAFIVAVAILEQLFERTNAH